MEVEYILIPLVGLLAFFLKGITGAEDIVDCNFNSINLTELYVKYLAAEM